GKGRLEDLRRGLEGGKHHDDDRRQHDDGVGDEDDLQQPVAAQRPQQAPAIVIARAGGDAHIWISRARNRVVMTPAISAMNRKIRTASALPSPKSCWPEDTLPKAVR